MENTLFYTITAMRLEIIPILCFNMVDGIISARPRLFRVLRPLPRENPAEPR